MKTYVFLACTALLVTTRGAQAGSIYRGGSNYFEYANCYSGGQATPGYGIVTDWAVSGVVTGLCDSNRNIAHDPSVLNHNPQDVIKAQIQQMKANGQYVVRLPIFFSFNGSVRGTCPTTGDVSGGAGTSITMVQRGDGTYGMPDQCRQNLIEIAQYLFGIGMKPAVAFYGIDPYTFTDHNWDWPEEDFLPDEEDNPDPYTLLAKANWEFIQNTVNDLQNGGVWFLEKYSLANETVPTFSSIGSLPYYNVWRWSKYLWNHWASTYGLESFGVSVPCGATCVDRLTTLDKIYGPNVSTWWPTILQMNIYGDPPYSAQQIFTDACTKLSSEGKLRYGWIISETAYNDATVAQGFNAASCQPGVWWLAQWPAGVPTSPQEYYNYVGSFDPPYLPNPGTNGW
jgi:hypothetical protein